MNNIKQKLRRDFSFTFLFLKRPPCRYSVRPRLPRGATEAERPARSGTISMCVVVSSHRLRHHLWRPPVRTPLSYVRRRYVVRSLDVVSCAPCRRLGSYNRCPSTTSGSVLSYNSDVMFLKLNYRIRCVLSLRIKIYYKLRVNISSI